jgi:RNA polymerase sigma-70 factor (ECF subfamily)
MVLTMSRADSGTNDLERDPRDAQDRILDRDFAAGTQRSLQDAYQRYGSLVFGYCRRSLSAESAADATQETFVAAWRSRDRYNDSLGSLGGWLMGIARFKVLEQLRRSGRDAGSLGEPTVHHAGAHEGGLETIADRMLVGDALETLPQRARSLIEMAFYGDLTHAEIAERTGIPLGTVKSDLRRGVERLRRHLESQLGGAGQ